MNFRESVKQEMSIHRIESSGAPGAQMLLSPTSTQGITMSAIDETQGLSKAVGAIVAISAAAFAFLVWIIYFRSTPESYSDAFNALPAVNALLNGLSATCILAGITAIRSGKRRVHMSFMISAFVFSTLFLASYIAYHFVQGDTKFLGQGPVRTLYFAILISHIGTTIFVLPLVLTTFFLALTGRFATHKKVARVTWPYVSVTGVAIFLLLRAHS